MEVVLGYITYENEQKAKEIVSVLLEKRLIACANIFPIKSSYWWKGKIEDSNEVVSIVKTRPELWDKLREEIERIHPYEVPCILRIEGRANESYARWLYEETLSP